MADGYYNIEFKLYSVSSGGSSEWTEDYTYNNGNSSCSGPGGSGDCRVKVANGYVSADLGSLTSFPGTINWNQQQWLTMNIGGTNSSGPITYDGEMSPRLLLTAVPYSLQAGQLGTTSGSNIATLGFTTPTGADSMLLPDASGTVCLQNASACGFAPSSGSSNYVQLQSSTPGTAQTGNFNISGTGIAAILQAGTFDTATSGILAIGTTNATAINLNQSVTIASAKNLTFAGSGNFDQSASSGTFKTGTGAVTLGGNTTVSGANTFATGTGTVSLNGATTVAANKAFTADGSVLLQDATNSTTAFQIQNATAVSLLTVDTSGNTTTLGKIAASGSVVAGTLVLADGTTDNFGATLNTTVLTASRTISLPNAAGTICLQNASACGFAASTGGSGYIQNQNSSQQASANFWISGSGRADTSFLTPLLDTASAGTLAIGTTNATAINLNQSVTIASAKNLTFAGSGNFDQSASSGTFATGTGAVTLNGNTTIAGSNTFTTGTGAVALNGATTVAANKAFTADGSVLLQDATNSTTAFQIQNAVGAPILLVDTTSTMANSNTVNYLTYPGFESGSFSNANAGWAAVAPATLSQNTNHQNSYNGLDSAQVVTTSGGGGLTTSSFAATPASGTYIVSFYAMVSSGSMGSNAFQVQGTDGGGTHACSPAAGITITTSAFQRLSCSITTTSNMTALQITQTDAIARTIYIDAVQLQTNSYNGNTITTPTLYQVGAIQTRGVITNPVALANNADSNTAFQIQNAEGVTIFTADTFNTRLTLGSASATPTLLVIGNKNTSGDPTEVDGAIYYNSNTGSFRCGQAGSWVNCLSGLLSSNTSASSTINGGGAGPVTANFSVTSSLPASYCVSGRAIHIIAAGILSTTVTAQPIAFAVKLGSTQVGGSSQALTPAGNLTARGWGLDFTIICDAAPGASVAVTGQGLSYVPGTTSANSDQQGDMPFIATNIATNASQTINISVTISGTNNALNTITLEQLVVTGM